MRRSAALGRGWERTERKRKREKREKEREREREITDQRITEKKERKQEKQ